MVINEINPLNFILSVISKLSFIFTSYKVQKQASTTKSHYVHQFN